MRAAMRPTDAGQPCPACGYAFSAGSCDRCGGRVHRPDHGPEIVPRPGFVLADLAHGFVSLFAGALELFHRREYIGKLGVAVAANAVVLVAVLIGFTFGLWEFFDWLLGTDWGGAQAVRGAASWLAGVLALVLAAISLFMLAPVLIETVMGPFLDPIAAATERIHGGDRMRPVELPTWKSIMVGVRSSAQILAIQIVILVPCLLLSLFGIGALLVLIVNAWFSALVWFDIPCGRRGLGLRERVGLIRRNWARAIGFGLAFQAGLFIPIFNFLLLTPAAAVAVSSLFFYFDKIPRRSEARPLTCATRDTESGAS
jgi:uncharacterized protein involved in cysteine biosynthesis